MILVKRGGYDWFWVAGVVGCGFVAVSLILLCGVWVVVAI